GVLAPPPARATDRPRAAPARARDRPGLRHAWRRVGSVLPWARNSPRASELLRRADFVQQRLCVEWIEAEPAGNLLRRGLRPLEEERPQLLAGLGAPPPVLPDLIDELRPQLRRADPRTQVVGRVEPGVHVGDEAVASVAHAGRLAEVLRVPLGCAAVLGEAAPEVELERKLRRIAAVEQRLEERR